MYKFAFFWPTMCLAFCISACTAHKCTREPVVHRQSIAESLYGKEFVQKHDQSHKDAKADQFVYENLTKNKSEKTK